MLPPPSWWPCDTWKIILAPFVSRRTARSFLIVAAPTIAANRIMATRSASSRKLGRSSKSEDRLDSYDRICARRPDCSGSRNWPTALIATLTIAPQARESCRAATRRARGATPTRKRFASTASSTSFAVMSRTRTWHSVHNSTKSIPRCAGAVRCAVEKINKSEAASLSLRGAAHLGHPGQRAESKGANLDSLRHGRRG